MRGIAWVLTAGSFLYVGCAGDSSALMSVWNDASVRPVGGSYAAGGAGAGYGGGSGGAVNGGMPSTGGVASTGGAPSTGGIATGVVYVAGGVRDLASAQCTATSGGTCPVSAAYLACLQTSCADSLTRCYYSDGIAKAVGGDCRDYANCMLGCPCDGNRSGCEDKCTQAFAFSGSCSMCLLNLLTCTSTHTCPSMSTCPNATAGGGGSAMSGSSVSGQAGVNGSAGSMSASGGAGGAAGSYPIRDGGSIIVMDAGGRLDARSVDGFAPPPTSVDLAPWVNLDARLIDGRPFVPDARPILP